MERVNLEDNVDVVFTNVDDDDDNVDEEGDDDDEDEDVLASLLSLSAVLILFLPIRANLRWLKHKTTTIINMSKGREMRTPPTDSKELSLLLLA